MSYSQRTRGYLLTKDNFQAKSRELDFIFASCKNPTLIKLKPIFELVFESLTFENMFKNTWFLPFAYITERFINIKGYAELNRGEPSIKSTFPYSYLIDITLDDSDENAHHVAISLVNNGARPPDNKLFYFECIFSMELDDDNLFVKQDPIVENLKIEQVNVNERYQKKNIMKHSLLNFLVILSAKNNLTRDSEFTVDGFAHHIATWKFFNAFNLALDLNSMFDPSGEIHNNEDGFFSANLEILLKQHSDYVARLQCPRQSMIWKNQFFMPHIFK